MGKKKTTPQARAGSPLVSEGELDRRHTRYMRVCGVVESLGTALLIVLGIAAFAYIAIALPVRYSAGKETTISFALNWVANVQLHVWLAWSAAAGMGTWAWQERKKRIRERTERDERITELEKQIDPNRTSSNLTPHGSEMKE